LDKYAIVIYWSSEDHAFISAALELPGCMAHGSTQQAALANAKEAIRLWIDTAKEFGDPVPEPKGERLMLA
jgi:predicted RNase H-like HicB family nuclease